MIWFALLFWACSGSNDSEKGNCDTMTDLAKKDSCYHDNLVKMPVSDIDAVIATGQKMVDPMIRGAAVAQWIKLHNNEINQQKGQELCALLDGRDRSYCMRRLSSPHLKR
jgi:hypothetical protein